MIDDWPNRKLFQYEIDEDNPEILKLQVQNDKKEEKTKGSIQFDFLKKDQYIIGVNKYSERKGLFNQDLIAGYFARLTLKTDDWMSSDEL